MTPYRDAGLWYLRLDTRIIGPCLTREDVLRAATIYTRGGHHA